MNTFRNEGTETQLDRTDCEIIDALQKNGRLSNKELAAKAGIAPSTCGVRLRRLVESGVLRGFHTDVDPRALGIGLQAVVAVRLRRHSVDLVESFRSHVLGLPEVVRVYHMAGADDFLIHVAVRDPEHLRELALTAFSSRPEVGHIQTSLVFEHVSEHRMPSYVEPEEW
jgi:DNA-binding Lrp family transcriptional regulator